MSPENTPDPVHAREAGEPATGVINKGTIAEEVGLFFNPALNVFEGYQPPPSEEGEPSGVAPAEGGEPQAAPAGGSPPPRGTDEAPPEGGAEGIFRQVEALTRQNAALQARTESLATILQSTTRTLAALTERLATPEPQAPAQPPPVPPSLQALAEKMAAGERVDASELHAAFLDVAQPVAATQVRDGFDRFGEAYAQLERERQEVETALKQEDGNFNMAALLGYLAANPLERAGYEALCSQGQAVDAARLAWSMAARSPAPPAQAQAAPREASPQARGATALPRGGQPAPPDSATERRDRLDKLRKASEQTGDRSPETERYALFRLFGVERVEDLAQPRPRARLRSAR